VERKHGKARRVWIFDRGVVSEENLVAIRKRGEEYLVGTTRNKLKQFEAELLKDDFGKIRPDVEVKQIKIPDAGRWAGPATDSSWPERPPPLALARCRCSQISYAVKSFAVGHQHISLSATAFFPRFSSHVKVCARRRSPSGDIREWVQNLTIRCVERSFSTPGMSPSFTHSSAMP
jgi:hypothetical protein